MNKKIYYNDKYIEFTGDPAQPAQNQSLEIIHQLDVRGRELKRIINDFLNEASSKSYVLVNQDFEKVIGDMKPAFHYIEAAGGFIQKLKKYLFIYRHNRWDLPKGKLEKGETARHCAVRECEEECGIKHLVIINQLSSTWHVYPHKGSHALKQTFWFRMKTDYGGKLLPQMEEDIHEVKWFRKSEIRSEALKNTYYTIADVVNEALPD